MRMKGTLSEVFSSSSEEWKALSERMNRLLEKSVSQPVKKPIKMVAPPPMAYPSESVERRLEEIANLQGSERLSLYDFIEEHAYTKFFVGKRLLSFVDILMEIASCSNFSKEYVARIKELNFTLKQRLLPIIPSTLAGLSWVLSRGESQYIKKQALLARYGIVSDTVESPHGVPKAPKAPKATKAPEPNFEAMAVLGKR